MPLGERPVDLLTGQDRKGQGKGMYREETRPKCTCAPPQAASIFPFRYAYTATAVVMRTDELSHVHVHVISIR